MIDNYSGEKVDPILAKYLKIDAGIQRLRSGEFKPFTEFPHSLDNRYNLSMLLTPNSVDEYETRIGEPVRQIEQTTGITVIMAGREYPMHVTLQEGQLPEDMLDRRDDLFHQLDDDVNLRTITDRLTDREMSNWFMGKYVLSDGTSLMLTSPHIPPVILDSRAAVSAVYEQAGLTPLPMDNILHSTLARITGIPEEGREEALEECYQRVMMLKQQISTQPVVMSVDGMYQGPAYTLVTGGK